MIEAITIVSPSERVVSRLCQDGWTSHSGVPSALCPHNQKNLEVFIPTFLAQQGGWILYSELQLETLIFSIADHCFMAHPHLWNILTQQMSQGILEIRSFLPLGHYGNALDFLIFLKPEPDCHTTPLGWRMVRAIAPSSLPSPLSPEPSLVTPSVCQQSLPERA